MPRSVATAALVACLALQSAAFADCKPAELTRSFTKSVPGYLEQYSVPGAAIAVIRGGKVCSLQGFGVADVAVRRPVTADTLFNVGSISKNLTAWGVLHLVDRHELDVDRPINEYLHRWQVPAGSFSAQLVTARRLLSHTAGISSHGYSGSDAASPAPAIEDILNGKTGAGAVSLVAIPGATFSYSGANYLILELAIEEISGEPFERYMREAVFLPLGMRHSSFEIAQDSAIRATPHDAASKALPIRRYAESAAAGLTTSVRDLANFAAAALPGSGRRDPAGRGIITSSLLAEAMQPVANTQWVERDPYGPAPQYGLGYNVRPEQYGSHTGVGHGGSNSGWESWFQVIPDTGDGIVIMTNSTNGTAVIARVLCEWRHVADPRSSCPTIEVRIPVFAEYRAHGVDAALALHERLRTNNPAEFDVTSRQLNSLGYQVMRAGDLPGAVRFFERNAKLFPDEWNVHDSLGEAYAAFKQRDAAIASYRRSLELNPYSESGKQALRELENEQLQEGGRN
jgi:CubicO group peptidase (beta-lactamase class C family)